MKSIRRTIIFALFCTAALASCTKQGQRKEQPLSRSVICLEARVGIMSVRGSIDQGGDFVASVAGWDASSDVADYSVAAKWHSTAQVKASSTGSAVEMTPLQYYNQNTTTKTFMKAWHPLAAPSANGIVNFTETSDGTVDVLFADQIWGTALSTPMPFIFTHPLTQLKFKVEGGGDYPILGNALSSIKIKGVELPVGLNLVTNQVVYGLASDLILPGIVSDVPIVSEAVMVGSAAMVKPLSGNRLMVDIKTTQKDYNDVEVTINGDDSFKPGKAYTITLTFTGKDIVVGATVDKWEQGDDTDKDVE